MSRPSNRWGSTNPLGQNKCFGQNRWRPSVQGVRWAGFSGIQRPYDPRWNGQRTEGHAQNAAESGHFESEEEISGDPRVRQMRVEAVLLLAKGPLSTRKLAQLAGLADGTEARTMIRRLNQTYDDFRRALRIEKVAGGFRLVTRPGLAPWLRRLGHVPTPLRLSSPMMETLAVVAYRQPVSRADTEAVRGVACGELLRQLLEKDLIRLKGRSEELGRPYLYGTTKRFLQLFGLTGIDALPDIDWQAVQEHDPDVSAESTPRDSSTSPKESVVSTALASPFALSDSPSSESPSTADDLVDGNVAVMDGRPLESQPSPVSVIEDEEDDLYEGVMDDDEEEIDDDEFSEDWDDDDEDEVDEDDEEEGDDLDDEEDDLEEDDDDDGWKEVSDDDDEDWDEGDDDEEDSWDDDESADDDEDWSE